MANVASLDSSIAIKQPKDECIHNKPSLLSFKFLDKFSIYTIWLKLDVKSTHERNVWLELHSKPTHESSMSSHPSSFGDSQEISVMYCNVNHSGRTKFWYSRSDLFSNLGTKTFQLVCLSWCNPQGAVKSKYLVCNSSNFNHCPRNTCFK